MAYSCLVPWQLILSAAALLALAACKPSGGYIEESFDGPFAYTLPEKWAFSSVPTPETARDYMKNREVPAYTCTAEDCGADTVLRVGETFLLWQLSSAGLKSVQSTDDMELAFDKVVLLASAIGSKPEGVKITGHDYSTTTFAGYPAIDFEADMETPERSVKVLRRIACAPRYCLELMISASGASTGQLLDLLSEIEPTIVLGETDPEMDALEPAT